MRSMAAGLPCSARLEYYRGTGPDHVSTGVLLMFAFELAGPIAKLIRRILYESRWPELWASQRTVFLHRRTAI